MSEPNQELQLNLDLEEHAVTVVLTQPETAIQMVMLTNRGPAGRDGRSLGWLFYKDSQYTVNNKRQIPANTRTQITNNALSPTVSTIYKPANAVWWNASQNKFVGDAAGDAFLVAVNLRLRAAMNNREVRIDFDIGTANYPHVENFELKKGAGFEYVQSFNIVILGSQGFINNGGTLNITGDGDLEIWDAAFKIVKLNQA